jgi:small subunit ribosomal protein S16
MVKIRLKNMGTKHKPSYRVVVADARAPRDGNIVENLGFYNPKINPPVLQINEEKTIKWLKQGAQPTESVSMLLKKLGTLEKAKAS